VSRRQLLCRKRGFFLSEWDYKTEYDILVPFVSEIVHVYIGKLAMQTGLQTKTVDDDAPTAAQALGNKEVVYASEHRWYTSYFSLFGILMQFGTPSIPE
jgi:hypothetical protein